MPLSRRQFLEDSMLAAAAAATAGVVSKPAPAQEASRSAGEKLTVAIVGCGIRGKAHASVLGAFQDVDIAYVCDPDSRRTAELSKLIAEAGRPAPKQVPDLRTINDDKAVDAVFICTCNHWHALAAIWAMQAGKHAYVEKPTSHNIREGRVMVDIARQTGRICQGGTQNRSRGAMASAVEYMRQGKLGKVTLARSIVYGRRGAIGVLGKYEVPSEVDYNLWCGPAPLAPLTRPRLQYDWHWVWDTGNGELGNNNVHSIDLCRWGLGITGLGKSVLSYGGRLGYSDAGQTPNSQVCIFDFGDKTLVTETRGLKTNPFDPKLKDGTIFVGTEGYIASDALFDPDGKLIRTFEGPSVNHFRNFLDCAKSGKREDQKAEILETHQSTALCHGGNISYRLGHSASPAEVRSALAKLKVHDDVMDTLDRTLSYLSDNHVDLDKTPLTLGPHLQIDGDHEAFAGNAEANKLLDRECRKTFEVPDRA